MSWPLRAHHGWALELGEWPRIRSDFDERDRLNPADATMRKRLSNCQNVGGGRADVSVTMTEAGRILEWFKYSAYGVVQRVPMSDDDRDGFLDIFDYDDWDLNFSEQGSTARGVLSQNDGSAALTGASWSLTGWDVDVCEYVRKNSINQELFSMCVHVVVPCVVVTIALCLGGCSPLRSGSYETTITAAVRDGAVAILSPVHPRSKHTADLYVAEINDVLRREMVLGSQSTSRYSCMAMSKDGRDLAVVLSHEMSRVPVESAVSIWWPHWQQDPERFVKESGYIVPVGNGCAISIRSAGQGVEAIWSDGTRKPLRMRGNGVVLSTAVQIPAVCNSAEELLFLSAEGEVCQVSRHDTVTPLWTFDSDSDSVRIDTNKDSSIIAVICRSGLRGRLAVVRNRSGVEIQLPGELWLSKESHDAIFIRETQDSLTVQHMTLSPVDLSSQVKKTFTIPKSYVEVSPTISNVIYSHESTISKQNIIRYIELDPSVPLVRTRGVGQAWVLCSDS